MTLERLVANHGYPARDRRSSATTTTSSSAAWSSTSARQPAQDGPLRTTSAAPTTAARRSAARRWQAALPRRAGAARRTRASRGSTPSSRCPRLRSSPASSSCWSPGASALDYGKLYDDIREAIDTVHRDDSLKTRSQGGHLARYIFQDPELGPALHKLRSGGKKLFLLTNSQLGLHRRGDALPARRRASPEYPSWRNYFDVVVTGADKPGFFSEQRPFVELDRHLARRARAGRGHLARARQGLPGRQPAELRAADGHRAATGCSTSATTSTATSSSRKKTSLWRTCMVVQELEDEIRYTEGRRGARSRGSPRWSSCARGSTTRSNQHKAVLASAGTASWSATARARRSGRTLERSSSEGPRRSSSKLRRALQGRQRHRRDARARRRGRLQPLLGPAVQGGQREQPLRRAGRAVRLPLHLAGEQPAERFADAVLAQPARVDAARTGWGPLRQARPHRQRGPCQGVEPGAPVRGRPSVSQRHRARPHHRRAARGAFRH